MDLEFLIATLADIADECDNRNLIKTADELDDLLGFVTVFAGISKQAYIQPTKIKGKKKYVVRSEKNPNWKGGTFSSRKAARRRLAEVEMFKHMKGKKKKGKKK